MSALITVSVAGSERSVAADTTAADLFADDKAVVVARVNDQLRDLAHVLADGDAVEPVTIDSEDGLAVLRHSAAHVLAQAVQEVNPSARLGIGPPIRDGFYYDFDVEDPFTPDDLKKLEKVMQRIVNEGQTFARRVISDDDARAELADEPYKLELIGLKGGAAEAAEGAGAEVGEGALTIYDNFKRDGALAWRDLCRGPHLPSTKLLGNAFKLMRSAAAYWRGSEKNPQLQRVYGTAWPSKDDLKAYLERLAEAERRDHRKLGAELDLFSFPDEIGSGMAVFHPKGGIIRREMEGYVRQRHIDEGFDFVNTPHISKDGLFHTSGHLPYYADTMFPAMELEGAEYRLKAMNCPMHNLIYSSRGRSYRELPLRLFEFGSVYRFERSGVVHGLTRVRGMTQDDSHTYCTPEQAPGEIRKLLDFVLGLLRDFGLDDFYLELSTRDESSDKFIGSDEDWAEATRILEETALASGPRARARPGRRGVLRAEDLGADPRRDRAHLADVDDPVRLQPARALRPGVPGLRRLAPAAGDDPLGEVRVDRALPRRARRALRRRLPPVARPGAGARHPGGRRVQRLPVRHRRPAEEAGDPGGDRHLRRPVPQEDPHGAEVQGAVHADRRRGRPVGRRGVVPLPRRVAEERRAGRRGGGRDRRGGRGPGAGLSGATVVEPARARPGTRA